MQFLKDGKAEENEDDPEAKVTPDFKNNEKTKDLGNVQLARKFTLQHIMEQVVAEQPKLEAVTKTYVREYGKKGHPIQWFADKAEQLKYQLNQSFWEEEQKAIREQRDARRRKENRVVE